MLLSLQAYVMCFRGQSVFVFGETGDTVGTVCVVCQIVAYSYFKLVSLVPDYDCPLFAPSDE